MKHTTGIFLIMALAGLLSMTSCKKETAFTYKATCNQCRISYYDENGNFVSKEPHQGSFEKKISVPQFGNVMVAVQSQMYLDSAAANPIFATDVIMVELFKEGERICSDTATGKKLQAVTCSYSWPK